jgi:hypothetical protein
MMTTTGVLETCNSNFSCRGFLFLPIRYYTFIDSCILFCKAVQADFGFNLDCLTEEDAGIYECVISNGKEKRSAATEVRIASFQKTGCHPHNRLRDEVDVKPLIHQWSEMYMQTTGDDALLICRAAGPHETYWIGPNGQPVDTKSEKYQMTKQGDLIVRNLSFEDMGNFQCLVKNINGSDMIETFVYPLAAS